MSEIELLKGVRVLMSHRAWLKARTIKWDLSSP